jgi:hypothetical protein
VALELASKPLAAARGLQERGLLILARSFWLPGTTIFCRLQIIALLTSGQPTLAGVPPALQIPGNAFTDRGYQRVKLFARWSIDPMKSQISIALRQKDAINQQHMKMQVQIQC